MYINLTANSAGTTPVSSRTNSINVVASGTWGSGTLAVQVYDQEASAWVTVYSNTANFSVNIIIGSGSSYRLTLSGSTSPDLDIYILPVYSKDLNV